MPCAPSRQASANTVGPASTICSLKQDTSLGIAQQLCQRGLTTEESGIAHILAVMLDKVEGVEDCGSSALPTGQSIEPRQAVRPEHNRLAVDREALGGDLLGSSRDRRQLQRL
jgi:hypothetical protein